jgi:predicted transcriptional regulator
MQLQMSFLPSDPCSILVCGGGGVAIHTTRKLKNMGSWVWQLQRTDVRRAEIEKMMAFVAKGDALSKEDVQKAFDSEFHEKG